jgi:hypothetical protein
LRVRAAPGAFTTKSDFQRPEFTKRRFVTLFAYENYNDLFAGLTESA